MVPQATGQIPMPMRPMNKFMPGIMEHYKPMQLTMDDFPFYKMVGDVCMMARKLPYILFMFGGVNMVGKEETDEMYFNFRGTGVQMRQSMMNLWTIMMNMILSCVCMCFMMVSMICMTFLPIWVMIPICLWFSPMIMYMMWPPTVMQGTTQSTKYRDEKWFFINGIGCDKNWMKEIQMKTEMMFGRPINMICNKTCGMMCDMMGISMMRNFQIPTMTYRLAYTAIKNALEDENMKKVVVLCHSDGGIICQMVIKRLLVEMDANMLSKMEIYTFGSAADRFEDGAGRIANIEHFANWYDYVAQNGVLHYKMMNPNHYCGNMYFSESFGHMFNQHYSRMIMEKSYRNKEGKTPRLYSYLGGGFPAQSQ
jgi:hypothetical protein